MSDWLRWAAGMCAVWVLSGALGCASDLLLLPESSHRPDPPKFKRELRESKVRSIFVTNAHRQRISGRLLARDADHGTVMVSGGNAMGRRATWNYTRFLHGRGFRVFVFSFQGYDDNQGTADLDSLLGDAKAFHAELRQRFPGEPIAYLASSISTAAALCLPAQAPDLSGVVLEGQINLRTIPFAKVRDWWPLWPLVPLSLPYAAGVSASVPGELSAGRCAERAGNVPALFVHHPQDRLTPYGGARALYGAYSGPKTFSTVEGRTNAQRHLVLYRNKGAQAEVLKVLESWLARGGG